MTNIRFNLGLILFAFALTLSSCDAAVGVLKTTWYLGVIFGILIVVLIIWLFNKAKGSNR